MKKITYAIFTLIVSLLPVFTEAKCYADAELEAKFNDLVFVVYCEDRSDDTAKLLVLSTVYNRAQSHDITLLYKEISKKNQYYCFNMKSKSKKLEQSSYEKTYDLVCDFLKFEKSPITKASYFYNHKLVRPSFVRTLKIVRVYGSHTYLF